MGAPPLDSIFSAQTLSALNADVRPFGASMPLFPASLETWESKNILSGQPRFYVKRLRTADDRRHISGESDIQGGCPVGKRVTLAPIRFFDVRTQRPFFAGAAILPPIQLETFYDGRRASQFICKFLSQLMHTLKGKPIDVVLMETELLKSFAIFTGGNNEYRKFRINRNFLEFCVSESLSGIL